MKSVITSPMFLCLAVFLCGISVFGCADDAASDSAISEVDVLDVAVLDSLVVPEWARTNAWYEIVVDRFRNGDPSNDPTVESMEGATSGYSANLLTSYGWARHPWGAPWFVQAPWERSISDDFYQTVEMRRYGGDIAGIEGRLDYLDTLGVRVLMLSGIADGPSLLKYDAANWQHVDRHFGPNPAEDAAQISGEDLNDPSTWRPTTADELWAAFLETAHGRGFHVVVSLDLGALLESTSDGESVSGLTHAVLGRWLDPNRDGVFVDGVDGFRLVDANDQRPDLVAEVRAAVKTMNPSAVLVGDVNWTEGNTLAPLGPFQSGALDGIVSHYFFREAREILAHPTEPGSATTFSNRVDSLLAPSADPTTPVLLTITETTNTPRGVTSIQNYLKPYYTETSPREDDRYQIFNPNLASRYAQRNILVMQFTLPGTPSLYYGTEVGMWGANFPDNVKPMVWGDLTYAEEATHPRSRIRPPDPVEVNAGQLGFFQQVVALYNDYGNVLSSGELNWLVVDDTRNLIAYERSLDGRRVVVAMTIQYGGQTVTYDELGLDPSLQPTIVGTATVADGTISLGAKGVVVFVEG